jgi:hypothetical protein
MTKLLLESRHVSRFLEPSRTDSLGCYLAVGAGSSEAGSTWRAGLPDL